MKKNLLLLCVAMSGLYADDSVLNLHRYMMANYYQFAGDLPTAGKWYGQITPQGDSLHVYNGYIPYLQAIQDHEQIVTLIPQLDVPFAKNSLVQTIFAQALEQTGQKSEAQKRLIALNDQNKANQELAFKVVQIYLENKELENALLVIENILNNSSRKSSNYVFLFLKSQIFLQLNKKTEALVAIQACIDAYPRFDKSWLLYAILQEQEGKVEQALKGYTNFLENTDEPHPEIKQHILQLGLKQKLAAQNNPKTQQDMPARVAKIEQLGAEKRYDEAARLLGAWAAQEPEHQELWLKLLHMLTLTAQDYILGLKTITALEHTNGCTLCTSLYRADLAIRARMTKQALEALGKAHKLTHDAALQEKILFQELLIHYDARDWNSFKRVMNNAPLETFTYAPLLNLVAYYDATKGKNLERAQLLIGKALAQEPKNPHFIDTQAQIWYKQKKYDQAIALLEMVADQCAGECSILHHLSKLHKANGSPENAAKYLAMADHKKPS